MAENQKPFLCGVIEGFYGRPWSFEQRIDLFQKMSSWGMQLYLYAPKDDEKHRNEWRDLYSLEEADDLSHLIKACEEKGVHFVYAVAPGLDIVFSKQSDVEMLKRKLDQLIGLGCKSFSILFDDIDPLLCPADAKVFTSSAHAQVSITNEIYEYIKKPDIFLFCPTEYCASRAVPTVKDSAYLNLIGTELHKSIDVLWTGPRVISKTISVSSIEELTAVLRRKPVIWDNLHANDYDQRRLFLGPYSGRSTNLIPLLNGVFTNPNCEYHTNFVAFHTLANWSKCLHQNKKAPEVDIKDTSVESLDEDEDEYMQSPSSSEGSSSPEHDQPDDCDSSYNPRRALEVCLKEWIGEFTRVVRRDKPAGRFDVVPATAVMYSGMQTDLPTLLEGSLMGTVPSTTNNTTSKEGSMTSGEGDDRQSMSETSSRMEVSESPENKEELSDVTEDLAETYISVQKSGKNELGSFDLKDLYLLVQFFYLPHKYGPYGVGILQDFSWLNNSAPTQHALSQHKQLFEQIKDSGEAEEEQWSKLQSVADPKLFTWYKEAVRFKRHCRDVCRMFARLTTIPNRPLLYDIYQYMWDAKEAIMLLDCYVSWLAAGGGEHRDDSWLPPDVEPFVLRGGITSAMQRLLPQLKGQDDFVHRKAPRPSPQIYTIRPYREEDKEAVYKVCLMTGDSGADGTRLYPNYPNLLGDRFVGPYTALSPELSFVLEDDEGVCGYVLAALDSKLFYSQFEKDWAPQVCQLYSLPHLGIKELTPEEEVSYSLHNPKFFIPLSLFSRHPSHIHIDILPRAQGKGVGSRMIRTILSALKAKGSMGVHLEMSSSNARALKFYLKFGFSALCFDDDSNSGDPPEGTLLLGRSL